jgi:hypothetical protein
MSCLTDGVLRARLDGELSQPELLEVGQHCAACADCRRRSQAIAHGTERVRQALAALAPAQAEMPTDARAALAQLRAGHEAFVRRPGSFAAIVFARSLRPAWVALAAACVVIALLSFTPARSWAQRLVGLLRVQKIAAVPLNFEALGNPSDRARMGKTIAQLLSDEVVVTVNPGEPQAMESREQATEAAGFKVRLLANRADPPQLKVLGEQAFHATIDRDRLQSILDDAGRSDLQLPYALDGATIAAQVPKIVLAEYGNCRHRSKDEPRAEGTGETECIEFVQAPSPTVTVPPELNLAELAQVALQLGGMSAETARDFSRSVDWGSTLVLGIPNGTSYRTIDVDGVQGTLIERAGRGWRGPPKYTLVWTKGGIIYWLTGRGDSADALTAAESLN